MSLKTPYSVQMDYKDVLNFWFKEITTQDWWKKSPVFDQLIRDRFLKVHKAAAAGELFHWRATTGGCLAEIIVLDQFSRNMFRDAPEAFAYDSLALILSQEAVRSKVDTHFKASEKSFLYMPYMHSESLAIHEEAVKLFSQPELDFNLDFELKHKKIIEQFGRYPHRNEILGRTSTPEEIEFLKTPGSSF